MLRRGLFITFEGIDGTGKTTQIEKTCRYLRGKGLEVVFTREPGGTRISELIRDILLDRGNTDMFPETEALLFAAARAQHVKEIIWPAVNEGKIVICDRFIDSSLTYQGVARGLGIDEVKSINELAVGDMMPDMTILLDLPAELAEMRRKNAGYDDRIEQNGIKFMKIVADGYRLVANEYKDRVVIIDVSGNEEDIFNRIRDKIEQKLYSRGLSI